MNENEMTSPPAPAANATARHATFREMATDAVRYWEPRRLIYNGVLAVVVLYYFVIYLPGTWALVNLEAILVLFLLAVLANCCYCAAYVPDLFAQSTGFHGVWRKWRGLLLTLGIVFAAVITRYFAMVECMAAAGPHS